MSELKPCPFCGANADVSFMEYQPYSGGRWFVECSRIECVAIDEDKQAAITIWNTRPKCEDCKHYEESLESCEKIGEFIVATDFDYAIPKDFYCAKFERKKNETE